MAVTWEFSSQVTPFHSHSCSPVNHLDSSTGGMTGNKVKPKRVRMYLCNNLFGDVEYNLEGSSLINQERACDCELSP